MKTLVNKIFTIGALGLSLASCNNFFIKGFDRIYSDKMHKEKLEISIFQDNLDYTKVKNISSEKNGIIVFEYQTDEENSDIFMIRKEWTYRITENSGYETNPQIKNNKIVFTINSEGYSNILLADLKNKELIKLTDDKRQNYSPTIDGGAKKIAFTRGEPEKAEVYLLDLEEKLVRNISDNESGDYFSYISGDGDRVGFVSERRGSSVYIKDLKLDTLILVDQSYITEFYDLRLNYDGTKIVYCGATSDDKNGVIFFKDLNADKKLSWPLNGGYDGEPSIDSAGRFISWVSRQKGTYERINKQLPFENRINKRKKKIGFIDKKGRIHIENKESKPKIKVVDLKIGQILEIENEISDEQMEQYISKLSGDGKSLIILNEKNKENHYQIKNPMHYKDDPKYFLKEEKEMWLME